MDRPAAWEIALALPATLAGAGLAPSSIAGPQIAAVSGW
jgi:hypothetical protein